jgi:anti-anti-sigma regulatory factor
MAGSNTTPDTLTVGSDERGTFLAARGEIRASLCWPLREMLLGGQDAADGSDTQPAGGGTPALGGGIPPAFYVDLSACHYMDSTFIGLLVAVDRKLRRSRGEKLHVICPSPECRAILSEIGLTDHFLVEETGPAFPPNMQVVAGGEKPAAEFVLKAHEALMETSEEARKKFAQLKEILEQKLKALKDLGPRDAAAPTNPRDAAAPTNPRDAAAPTNPRDAAAPTNPRDAAAPSKDNPAG